MKGGQDEEKVQQAARDRILGQESPGGKSALLPTSKDT